MAPPVTSGLELWVDASAITGVSNGASVGTWSDLSGNARDLTQATGTAQPTYATGIAPSGLPALRFTSANSQYMTGPVLPVTSGYTIIAVVRVVAANVTQQFCGNGSGNGYGLKINTPQRELLLRGLLDILDGNATTATEVYQGDGPTSGTGGTHSLRINNGAATTGSGAMIAPTTRFTVGAFDTLTSEFVNGWIHEVIAYSRQLNSTELQQTYDYLNAKWLQAPNVDPGWSPGFGPGASPGQHFGNGPFDALAWWGTDDGGAATVVAVSAGDTLTLTDATTGQDRTGPDVLALTDAGTLAAASTAAETLALTDAATLAASASAGETLTTSDAGTLAAASSASEVLALTDAAGSQDRAAAETLTGTDAAGAQTRTAAEVLGLADAPAGITVPVAASEALTLTDAGTLAASSSAGETLQFADAGTLAATSTAGETLTLTDQATGVGVPVSASDTLTLTDVGALAASATAGETLALADAAGQQARTAAEQLALTDAVGTVDQGSTPKSDGDTLTLTDATGARTAAASDAETLTLSDAAAAQARAAADVLALTDQAAGVGVPVSAADAAALTDAVAALTVAVTAADVLALTDAPGSQSRAAGDALALADAVSAQTRGGVDVLALVDAATAPFVPPVGIPAYASTSTVLDRLRSSSTVGGRLDQAAVTARTPSTSSAAARVVSSSSVTD